MENETKTPAPAVMLRSNRDVNSTQIHDCLTSIGTLTNCLRVACSAPDFGADPGTIKALDGGARSALEVSLAKACDRLDSLIDDKNRWTVPEKDSHGLATTYFAQQIEMQAQQIEAARLQLETLQHRFALESAALQKRLAMENEVARTALAEMFKKEMDAAYRHRKIKPTDK